MTDPPASGRPRAAVTTALAVLLAGGVGFAFSDWGTLTRSLTFVLAGCAFVAGIIAAQFAGSISVSGQFVAAMLAVGFLGPAPAFAIPLASEVAVWAAVRYRSRALVINLAGTAAPTFCVAVAFSAVKPDSHEAWFAVLLAVAAGVTLSANALFVGTLMSVLDGRSVADSLRSLASLIPAWTINIAITVALAVVYAQTSLAVISLLLLVIVGFTYMARLLGLSRERTRQYANLSWGVLSGLIRTLDERDSRAARHCAAVAKFSRDIAKVTGMSERDQELAHTAGLLHDIGKFVLSDRVMERDAKLTEEDWKGIRRHPEIGADLLQDIGVYGPVAEIVLSHHERIDGRGYPKRLKGEDIPAIARIVAVAEVYDTLTAPDTYRTQMNSFEALTELRRVSGTQLDATYVEALAELLAGQGTDYRHADEADFDRELDIERRMNEAAAP